jgi:tetratricopeptide (TPR) repeat protein
MKTDEKAGANEALNRNAGYKTVTKADEECALAAFHQANDLLNNGLFPQAAARYREALRCWDHPAIHYNLALALINLNEPIEVFEQVNEGIKYGSEPIGQDKFDHAREYLKLVAGQLADVEVSCDKPGAKVALDGKEVFVAPGSHKAKVRVGKHTFYGEKEGYNARVTAPFIGPGETFRIELKLYTAEELTRYRRRWDRTWMPYTVIGAGALVGIIGGVFELSASSSYKDFDTAVAKCNTAAMGCASSTPGLVDMRNSGDTKRTIGFVGYGVAGAAIATGAVLAYLNRRTPYTVRPEDIEEPIKEQPASPVGIAPIVSPEMTGALVQGHF